MYHRYYQCKYSHYDFRLVEKRPTYPKIKKLYLIQIGGILALTRVIIISTFDVCMKGVQAYIIFLDTLVGRRVQVPNTILYAFQCVNMFS